MHYLIHVDKTWLSMTCIIINIHKSTRNKKYIRPYFCNENSRTKCKYEWQTCRKSKWWRQFLWAPASRGLTIENSLRKSPAFRHRCSVVLGTRTAATRLRWAWRSGRGTASLEIGDLYARARPPARHACARCQWWYRGGTRKLAAAFTPRGSSPSTAWPVR